MLPVKEVLENAGITKNQINKVILVGGSTRIPKVSQMLSEYFGNAKLKRAPNPDTAVALGAATLAFIMNNKTLP